MTVERNTLGDRELSGRLPEGDGLMWDSSESDHHRFLTAAK